MRAWLVVAAGALLLLTAVAVEAPAVLADRQLDAHTNGRLRIADAAGTLWNGSGALVLLPNGARIPVLWHLDAMPLLRSHLSGTLSHDSTESAQSRYTFDVGPDDFAVRNLAVALPAEALLRAGNAPAIVTGAGGMVELRADAFAMHRGAFEGNFVVRWLGASLPGPRPEVRLALGDVRLDGVGSGGEVKGLLSNAGGDIEINGTLTLGGTGAARLEARLKPRAGVDAERFKAIQAALSMIGAADDSGGFRVAWQVPGR
jgi:hypothetical protein